MEFRLGTEYEQFFSNSIVPSELEQNKQLIQDFVARHNKEGRRIALVTSGGTTIPLEKNTVRFLDNFSGGGRGAASTEYLIEHGYAVIFLNRRRSLQPYERNLLQGTSVLDAVVKNPTTSAFEVGESLKSSLVGVYDKYHKAISEGMIIKVVFQTVHDYLHYLRCASQILSTSGKKALIYSAAAVSDYYIPLSAMAEHKIQSSQGALVLKFEPVPKMLKPLCSEWSPTAYIVTFKLETDINILPSKAQGALNNYGHELVIGNLLQSHRDQVTFFYRNGTSETLSRSREEQERNDDLEKIIIQKVAECHEKYLAAS